jgi:RND family efflux transporter MFP subunit
MAEAQLENARAQRDRMVELHGRGSVTQKGLEDATAGYRVAEAGLEAAQANLAVAEVMLGYAEVRSPMSGWVVEKRIEAGDMATPGSPLFTIEELSQVKVSVQVPEADVVGLAEGAPARVEVLDRELVATVDRVVPSGDPASRTFVVNLILDNVDASLKSGMFARVVFERGVQEVLQVPRDAIVRRGQLEGLYVAGGDDRLRLRWVKTGRETLGAVEILSGLSIGERYAVKASAELTDGTRYEEKG